MNPFQVMGLIACCVALFAGTVMFLTAQGVPLPVAFFGVYVGAIGCMIGMQRRARASCEGLERRHAGERGSRATRSRTRQVDVEHDADTSDALYPPHERFRA